MSHPTAICFPHRSPHHRPTHAFGLTDVREAVPGVHPSSAPSREVGEEAKESNAHEPPWGLSNPSPQTTDLEGELSASFKSPS